MKNLLSLILSATFLLSTTALVSAENSETDASKETAAEPTAMLDEKQLKLGKRAFMRCQACHTLGEGEEHRTGPNLHALFGAIAGQKEGFVYSEALIKSELEWTDESLRAWLKAPASYIPGNKMAFGGVPSDREMDALMSYLKHETN